MNVTIDGDNNDCDDNPIMIMIMMKRVISDRTVIVMKFVIVMMKMVIVKVIVDINALFEG